MKVTIDLDSSYEPGSPEARAFVKSMDKQGIDAKYEDMGGMNASSLLLTGNNKKIYMFLVDVEWFGDREQTVHWVETRLLRK